MKKSFGTLELIKSGVVEQQEILVEEDHVGDDIRKLKHDLEMKVQEGYHAIVKHPLIVPDGSDIGLVETTIYLSPTLDEKDYDLLLNTVQDRTSDQATEFVYIHNYLHRHHHLDYDLYQQSKYSISDSMSEDKKRRYEKLNQEREPLKILDLFLRRKRKQLSEEEIDMFQQYEEFHLDDILFTVKMHDFPLNNGDAGLITIFEDREYKTAVTKLQHGTERDAHVEWYREETLDQRDDPNYICIHLYHHGIVGFIPENLNAYQVQKMDEFIQEVKDLQETYHQEIDANFAIVAESGTLLMTQSFDSIPKFEQYMVENYKGKEK